MKYLITIFMLFSLLGCASSGVVPADKGTFLITKRSLQAGFGPPVGAKAAVYKEAHEYCQKHGKELETVKFDMTNSGFGRPGSVSLKGTSINPAFLKLL